MRDLTCPTRSRSGQVLEVAAGLLALTLAAGCPSSSSSKPSPTTTTPPQSAYEVLDRMVAQYNRADTYRDEGKLTIRFVEEGQPRENSAPFATTFQRPNLLRLEAYQGTVVCDGRKLRATIADLPGQVLESDAPDVLRRVELYADPLLEQVLARNIASEALPIPLLLDRQPLDPVLQGASAPELLADEAIEGHPCYRVRVKTPEGQIVFWIDRESFALRRLEYPTEGMLRAMRDQGNPVTEVTMVADFVHARLNGPINPAAFAFEMPAESKLVSRFTLTPPSAKAAEASNPEKLKLVRLWENDSLQRPGNVLVVPGATESDRVLVCDGFRAVVEFDAAGQILARHELDLPGDSVATYLRTAVDSAGERVYVACGPAQQQLHVLDEQFQRKLSFPADPHPGISDVQLGDLDGDGTLELVVGYWDVVGVQGVSLSGQRMWSVRSVENVTRLALVDPNRAGQRMILCAHSRGFLSTIDGAGREGRPIVVGHRFVQSMVGMPLAAGQPQQWCGLAPTAQPGELTAVGFNLAGEELWSYPLPFGLPPDAALEMITGGVAIAGESSEAAGVWVIAGGDGSIHLLSAGGELVDRFAWGESLSGLGVAQLAGQPSLIVATPSGIAAVRLTTAGR